MASCVSQKSLVLLCIVIIAVSIAPAAGTQYKLVKPSGGATFDQCVTECSNDGGYLGGIRYQTEADAVSTLVTSDATATGSFAFAARNADDSPEVTFRLQGNVYGKLSENGTVGLPVSQGRSDWGNFSCSQRKCDWATGEPQQSCGGLKKNAGAYEKWHGYECSHTFTGCLCEYAPPPLSASRQFRLFQRRVEFSAAASICRTMGARLAEPRTDVDVAAMRAIGKDEGKKYWIGVRRNFTSDFFVYDSDPTTAYMDSNTKDCLGADSCPLKGGFAGDYLYYLDIDYFDAASNSDPNFPEMQGFMCEWVVAPQPLWTVEKERFRGYAAAKLVNGTFANELCRSHGGFLAGVYKEKEQQAMVSQIPAGAPARYFLGGSDRNANNVWQWVYGDNEEKQPIFSTGSTCSAEYCNWSSGQPDNAGSGESDMYLDSTTGEWHDTTGNQEAGYICEFSIPTRTMSASLAQPLYASGPFRLYPPQGSIGLDDLDTMCQGLAGGNLAWITTPEDFVHVKKIMEDFNGNAYVGAKLEGTYPNEAFRWSYGSAAGQLVSKKRAFQGVECEQSECYWCTLTTAGCTGSQPSGSGDAIQVLANGYWDDIGSGLTGKGVMCRLPSAERVVGKYARYSTPEVKAWDEAAIFCSRQGGWLASIISGEDRDAITELLDGLSGYSWIGARNVSGTWRWMFGPKEGQALGTWDWSTGVFTCAQEFCDWVPDEPNGSGDYLNLYANGKIDDTRISNSLIQNVVCEFNYTTPTNEPTPTKTRQATRSPTEAPTPTFTSSLEKTPSVSLIPKIQKSNTLTSMRTRSATAQLPRTQTVSLMPPTTAAPPPPTTTNAPTEAPTTAATTQAPATTVTPQPTSAPPTPAPTEAFAIIVANTTSEIAGTEIAAGVTSTVAFTMTGDTFTVSTPGAVVSMYASSGAPSSGCYATASATPDGSTTASDLFGSYHVRNMSVIIRGPTSADIQIPGYSGVGTIPARTTVSVTMASGCFVGNRISPPFDFVVLPVTPPPPPPPEEPVALETTKTVGQVAGTLSGLGSPAMASQMRRSSIVLGLKTCQPDGGELDRSQYPLGLAIASGDYAFYIGGSMMNHLALVIFGILLVFIAFVYSKVTGSDFDKGCEISRFPSLLAFPLMLLLEPTAMCATVTIIYADDGLKAFGIVSLVLCVGMPAGLAFFFKKKHEAEFDARFKHPNEIGKLEYFFFGTGKWLDIGGRNATGYCQRHRLLFCDYTQERYWFLIIEMLMSIACGVLDGVKLGFGRCGGIIVALILVFAIFLAVVLIMRPYNNPFLFLFAASLTACQLSASICVGVDMLGDNPAALDWAENFAMVCFILLSLRFLYDFGPKGFRWYKSILTSMGCREDPYAKAVPDLEEPILPPRKPSPEPVLSEPTISPPDSDLELSLEPEPEPAPLPPLAPPPPPPPEPEVEEEEWVEEYPEEEEEWEPEVDPEEEKHAKQREREEEAAGAIETFYSSGMHCLSTSASLLETLAKRVGSTMGSKIIIQYNTRAREYELDGMIEARKVRVNIFGASPPTPMDVEVLAYFTHEERANLAKAVNEVGGVEAMLLGRRLSDMLLNPPDSPKKSGDDKDIHAGVDLDFDGPDKNSSLVQRSRQRNSLGQALASKRQSGLNALRALQGSNSGDNLAAGELDPSNDPLLVGEDEGDIGDLYDDNLAELEAKVRAKNAMAVIGAALSTIGAVKAVKFLEQRSLFNDQEAAARRNIEASAAHESATVLQGAYEHVLLGISSEGLLPQKQQKKTSPTSNAPPAAPLRDDTSRAADDFAVVAAHIPGSGVTDPFASLSSFERDQASFDKDQAITQEELDVL